MKAFWWKGHANFGDAIAPLLLRRYAGIEASWSPAAQSEVVVVGSIATMLPRSYTGHLLGIGKARNVPITLALACVKALRGPLTLHGSGVDHPVALGDPGLLASGLVKHPRKLHPLGVVAHWQDRLLFKKYPDARLIDVSVDPVDVIAQIGACERIVSSSLHGIIVADAFGIPRLWDKFDRTQGDGFKFADYGLSIGEDLKPGRWGEASVRRVKQVQLDLTAVFAEFGDR